MIEGRYVLRIKVAPDRPGSVYQAYTKDDKPKCNNLSVWKNGCIVRVTQEDEYTKLFLPKYKAYDPKNILRCCFNQTRVVFHSQKCFSPLGGEGQTYLEHQKVAEYKHYTLLVTEADVKEVEQILTKTESDIVVRRVFDDFTVKFSLSKTTLLIKHNVKYKRIQDQILKNPPKKPESKSKKAPILISVSNMVKIKGSLQPQILNFARQKLQSSGLKEIKFRYLQSKVEEWCCLDCESMTTAIFLYFFFREKDYTCRFQKILKDYEEKQYLKNGVLNANQLHTGYPQQQQVGYLEPNYYAPQQPGYQMAHFNYKLKYDTLFQQEMNKAFQCYPNATYEDVFNYVRDSLGNLGYFPP